MDDLNQVEALEVEELEPEVEDTQDEAKGEPPAVADEIESIGFADEAPEKTDGESEPADPFKGQQAPEWVKQTRQENRELKRKLRELEESRQPAGDAQKLPDLGPKPTLAGVDYDEDELAKQLDAWHEQKAKIAAAKAEAEAEQRKQQERWGTKLQTYQQAKTVLKRDDYDEAEAAVQDALTQTQIGVLLSGVKDPASLVYALGKSPAKLQSLKGLEPIETAFALARMEAQVQVNRKPKVSGEPNVKGGTGRMEVGSNAKLAQLEAEADRTGDRSKILAYRQQMRTAQSK